MFLQQGRGRGGRSGGQPRYHVAFRATAGVPGTSAAGARGGRGATAGRGLRTPRQVVEEEEAADSEEGSDYGTYDSDDSRLASSSDGQSTAPASQRQRRN